MTLAWLNLVQVVLLAVLILLQTVVIRDRAVAVTVAREAAEAGRLSAVAAEKAAFTARMTLDRIEALFTAIEAQGGQTLRATVRMEDATAVVASNLAGDKTRAKDRLHADDYAPGAAADAYATTPEEEPDA